MNGVRPVPLVHDAAVETKVDGESRSCFAWRADDEFTIG